MFSSRDFESMKIVNIPCNGTKKERLKFNKLLSRDKLRSFETYSNSIYISSLLFGKIQFYVHMYKNKVK